MPFLEDYRIGDKRELGSHTFTAEEIKLFAAQFDPQPFHLSEEAGKASLFGGLAASGWHTTAVYMKVLVADMNRQREAALARGESIVASGPSPGFTNLKWPRPVLAGDTISYTLEVIDLRASASRPQWGIVLGRAEGFNQRGEQVLTFENSVFVPRRGQT
jgi:acyl dehydratase